VTAPFEDEPVYLTELPDDLRARRAQAARRRRIRRRLVALAIVVVVGAIAAVVVRSLVGDGGSNATSQGTQPEQPAAGGTGATTNGYPADWRPYTGPVPILEYHAIQPPVSGAAYPELFVPQGDFESQMKWLDDHGYEGVTLDQVEDAWYKHGELPSKPVVLTFDDGYLSQFVAAFPALEHYGWPGVINLVAKGSDLPNADVNAVETAGYRGATSEVPGLATAAHPYVLNRIEIQLSDGLNGFASKLQAAESGSTAGSPASPGG
jgi:hypothetical protein